MNSVLNASLFGGLFVVGVALLCLVFRRLPAWVRAWLWAIASVQFLVRLVLTLPISVPGTTVPVSAPAASSGVALPSYTIDFGASAAAAAATPFPLWETVWGVGILLGIVIAARRLLAARSLVRSATSVEDLDLLGLRDELARGLRRPPRIVESARVKCPLLVGVVRPTIVVPQGYAAEFGTPEVRMALAHEIAHIRRGDPWLSLVTALTQIVFFFHPLAWWAGRESALAREEACDLDVVRLCAESPNAYAHFLLKSAQARIPVAGLGAAYGYRNLRRRITMLKGLSNASLSHRRTWMGLIAAGLAASLPWTVVGQTAPSAPALAPAPAPSQVSAPKAAPAIAIAPKAAPAKRSDRTAKAGKKAQASKQAIASAPAQKLRAPRATMPVGTDASEVAAVAAPYAVPTAPAAPSPFPDGIAAAAPVTEMVVPLPPGSMMVEVSPRGDLPLQRKVRGHFVATDVKEAILKVLTDSGANFVIKAKIQPATITGRFANMTVEEVLRAIFRGIDQELTWRSEGDVIYIVERGVTAGAFGGSVPGVGAGGFGGGGGLGGFGGGSTAPAGGAGGSPGLGGGSNSPGGAGVGSPTVPEPKGAGQSG